MHITSIYANIIDSLKTKEDVQLFLLAPPGKHDITYASGNPGIEQTLMIPLYLSIPDTVWVEEPITHEMIMKTTQRYPDYPLSDQDTQFNYSTIENSSIAEWVTRATSHFYKADIDGNGYTDLVIGNKGIVVIMDMGGKFESYHIYGSNDFSYYSFKSFIPLPDGGACIRLLSHPCTINERARDREGRHKTIKYMTKKTSSGTDTLYKIITVSDTTIYYTSDTPSIDTWVDTVDMKRYRFIDTIVYKFGGFVKYNPLLKPAGVSKINYYHGQYAGYDGYSCIEINKKGRCFLKYSPYDTTFTAILDNERLQDLWKFIAYADVKSKKSFYYNRMAYYYHFGGVFVIYFDDGSVKEIFAGGLPMDMTYLGKMLSNISRSISWEPSENDIDFKCPCEAPDTKNYTECEDCTCDDIDIIY